MRSFKHYLLILTISLLPLLSIFLTPDMPHTHDGPVHLARIAEYYKSLIDGQIPPRWAGNLNYGYGTPVFIFLYPLPYFWGAAFLALGSNLILSFKLLLLTSFLLSGIFMYLFTLELTRDKRAAFLVTLFYQFAPYRLVQLVVRGSFAEAFTFTFLPATLWGVTKLTNRINYPNFVLTALAAAALVLSHNSISLVFFGILIYFVLFFVTKRISKFVAFSALATGLVLSAFYWMPAIIERQYTYGDLFMRDIYKVHFTPFYQLLLPNFINDPRLQTGGISVQLGVFHVAAIIMTLWMLWKGNVKNKITRTILVFASVILAVSIFLMQPISTFLWERVAILRQFQFPWRLLSATTFATSLLSLSLVSQKGFKKPLVFAFLCLLVPLSTVYYWWPPLGFDKIDINYFWNYPLNTTYFGEADVIWAAGPASGYPNQRVETVSGEGKITNFSRRSTLQAFSVEAQTPLEIVSHTLYFPGWRVYVDGQKTPIQFQNQNWRGLIMFPVPAGTHEVRVAFSESKVRLVADIISLATALALLVPVFYPTFYPRKKSRM